jgi:hypothetical protein
MGRKLLCLSVGGGADGRCRGPRVAIRPSQVFKAGPADELPSSLILRVKLVGAELWVLEWEPRTHKPGRTQIKDGEPTAQPKPEPLSPSTRAKLVTDVARLLVTKCPHVPLNTYMQFGSIGLGRGAAPGLA